jgi:hypothetical protein
VSVWWEIREINDYNAIVQIVHRKFVIGSINPLDLPLNGGLHGGLHRVCGKLKNYNL